MNCIFRFSRLSGFGSLCVVVRSIDLQCLVVGVDLLWGCCTWWRNCVICTLLCMFSRVSCAGI